MARKNWMTFFAFIAVFCLALALVLPVAFELLRKLKIDISDRGLIAVLQRVAFGIAVVVTLLISHDYAVSKKKSVWWILWIVAVVIIAVCFVWGFFL